MPPPQGGSDIGAAISWSITKLGQNFGVLLGLTVLIAIAGVLEYFVTPSGDGSFLATMTGFLLQLVFVVLRIVLMIGLIRAALRITLGEKASFSHLTDPQYFWQYVGVSIVVGVVYFLLSALGIGGLALGVFGNSALAGVAGLIIGLIAFVVGIVLTWAWQFSQYAVVDHGPGVFPALRESWELVMAHKGQSVLVMLVVIVANILGALCFGVGLLVTMPIAILVVAFVYRQFRGESVAA